MIICKSGTEYERELSKLRAEVSRKIGQIDQEIYAKYEESLESASGMEFKQLYQQYEKEISDAYHKAMNPIKDFIKSQPNEPKYIFKANRRYYYQLKIDWITGEYTKFRKPIPDIRLFQMVNKDWIVFQDFSGSAFDIAICLNCKKEFFRHKPNQKFCPLCRRSPRSKRPRIIQKTRFCQNPGCENPIPSWKNNRAKYCSDACKTAAYEKRK